VQRPFFRIGIGLPRQKAFTFRDEIAHGDEGKELPPMIMADARGKSGRNLTLPWCIIVTLRKQKPLRVEVPVTVIVFKLYQEANCPVPGRYKSFCKTRNMN